jgi:NAD(P)-dependent dehydrogenase (short-subunit alcohol dehydrogenase family)
VSGVAIVTGGSRGIGRATAILLAERGYDIVVNYQSNAEAAADTVAAVLRQGRQGRQAVAVMGDVGDEADVAAIFAAADKLGRLTALVNNAGVIDAPQRLDEMDLSRLDRMFRINLTGSFLCAREAVKRMSTRHGGQGGGIVNLSSAAAVLAGAGQYLDYAAAKAGIDIFTLGLAREVAAEGIRVNAVRPGIIDTEIHASGGMPDRVAALRDQLPMKREGTAREVAQAIAWLLSAEASYTNGTVLNVTGGR